MADEPEPRETSAPHDRRPRLAIRPAIRCGLDLGPGDSLAWPVGKLQVTGNDEDVNGDAAQRSLSHLQIGAVSQVTQPLLGQWTVPLSGQCVGPLEKLLEHVEPPLGVLEWASGSTINELVMWRSSGQTR
jgi:hypothetical protein